MADLGVRVNREQGAAPPGYEYYTNNLGYRALRPIQAPTPESLASLLTPAEQLTQSNTTADRAAREAEALRQAGLTSTAEANRVAMAEADRQLATTAEGNRLATSTADRDAAARQAEAERLSREGLSASEIAARMAELRTGAELTDTNAARASARADASRMAMLNRIPGLFQTVMGGSGGAAPATAGTDPTAANDATFNAAKDKTGAIGRGSMTALREGGAERGTLGSGLEGGGMASLLNEGTKRLADVNRQQTISGVDTANQMANRNYAGAITKRGQDLGVSSSILSLLGSRAY